MEKFSLDSFIKFESDYLRKKPFNLELAEEKIIELEERFLNYLSVKKALSHFYFDGGKIMIDIDAQNEIFKDAYNEVEALNTESKTVLEKLKATYSERLQKWYNRILDDISEDTKYYLAIAQEAQNKGEAYSKKFDEVKKAILQTEASFKELIRKRKKGWVFRKIVLKIVSAFLAFCLAWLSNLSQGRFFSEEFIKKQSLLILIIYFILDLISDFLLEYFEKKIRKNAIKKKFKSMKEQYELVEKVTQGMPTSL